MTSSLLSCAGRCVQVLLRNSFFSVLRLSFPVPFNSTDILFCRCCFLPASQGYLSSHPAHDKGPAKALGGRCWGLPTLTRPSRPSSYADGADYMALQASHTTHVVMPTTLKQATHHTLCKMTHLAHDVGPADGIIAGFSQHLFVEQVPAAALAVHAPLLALPWRVLQG